MAQLPYLVDTRQNARETFEYILKKTSGKKLTINRMNTKEIF